MVINHMGSEMKMSLNGLAELILAVQRGQFIATIKAVRAATPGLGLKEAKELVQNTWSETLAEEITMFLNQEPQF